MQSVLPLVQSHTPSKKSLKAVLGFGALSLEDAAPIRGRSSIDTYRPREPIVRASIDTTRSLQPKRSSVEVLSNTNIGSHSSTSSHAHQPHAPQANANTNTSVRSMNSLDAAPPRAMRRHPLRIDVQEGPWTISVAETPHDARSYSIYIKSAFIFATLTPFVSLKIPNILVCLHYHFQTALPLRDSSPLRHFDCQVFLILMSSTTGAALGSPLTVCGL